MKKVLNNTKLYQINDENIFKALFKNVSQDLKEARSNNTQEFYLGEQLVAKILIDSENIQYYMAECIIEDVTMTIQSTLSNVELNFINEALAGDIINVVNIKAMAENPVKTIFEEAKRRGFPKVGKNDFAITQNTTIKKEAIISE